MLAIVIPYFKITFFKETLDSLANQTDKRFNVYIGDDASLEDPTELLEKYKGQFNFEYHRFESNLGSISLVKQWERCIELFKDEEWIMILGDDDKLGENVVELFYKNFNIFNKKSYLIRFATKVIFQKSNTISNIFKHPIWEKESTFFSRLIKSQTRSSLSEYIFYKLVYKKYGFKDYYLGWGSDCNACLDFSDGKKIFTINDAIVYFRISDKNISGNKKDLLLKNNASIQLFKDIIINKLHLFNKIEKLEILMIYEVTIKKYRKLSLKEWFFLFKKYILILNFISIIKFIRRFFISVIS
ncbi:glycosyltransferase family A protein [uncultured Lutibacter sp.]|uniref:glycosyltransferase family A protein n=1 Tax=uncultured Lutibacter sp. TaxID=437739 RepID=UPI0026207573|nr:glycosyltransferase family A protein [uncultured Lutibacter sp.]